MNIQEVAHSLRAVATWICSTLLASLLFWSWFGACVVGCIDAPVPELEPPARIVASWDPLACGDPHRVVVELEDDEGEQVSRSVPCNAGGLTLDVPRWGVYAGRIYAWTLGPEIRSVLHVRLEVDAPIIFWTVETPR